MARSNIDKLMELKQLYEQGVLTKEEMETEKAKIINSPTPKVESPSNETPLIENAESSFASTSDEENHGRNNKVIIGIAAVIVVAIVAVIGFYLNKQTEPKKAVTDDIELAQFAGDNNINEENENANNKTIENPEKQTVGTLTAYYAKKDISITDYSEYYKQGQLICDSNDPINRIVDADDYNYKYEGNETDTYYSYLIPKAEVTKKEYTMHQLTINNIGNRSVFVSNEGAKVTIFKSKINGHHYLEDNGEVNWEETNNHKECYVLSMRSYYNAFWELPLREKQGIIELYQISGFSENPNDCRYREGPIGIIEEEWENGEEWDNDKSAYDKSGNLLVDQKPVSYLPSYISIAYIADIDALYINGFLYYRKQ